MKGLIVNASPDKDYRAARIAYITRKRDDCIENTQKKLSEISDKNSIFFKIQSMRLHVNEFYKHNELFDIDIDSTDLISKKEVMELLERGKLTPERLKEMFTISL